MSASSRVKSDLVARWNMMISETHPEERKIVAAMISAVQRGDFEELKNLKKELRLMVEALELKSES